MSKTVLNRAVNTRYAVMVEKKKLCISIEVTASKSRTKRKVSRVTIYILS